MATKKAPAKTAAPAAKKTTAAPAKKSATATKMTKAEWIRFAAEKLELTNKQSAAFTELLAATAIQETKKNGEFTIPGIGKLVKAQRAARMGRNPATGESIKIAAKTTVKFRIGKAVKDAVVPPKR